MHHPQHRHPSAHKHARVRHATQACPSTHARTRNPSAVCELRARPSPEPTLRACTETPTAAVRDRWEIARTKLSSYQNTVQGMDREQAALAALASLPFCALPASPIPRRWVRPRTGLWGDGGNKQAMKQGCGAAVCCARPAVSITMALCPLAFWPSGRLVVWWAGPTCPRRFRFLPSAPAPRASASRAWRRRQPSCLPSTTALAPPCSAFQPRPVAHPLWRTHPCYCSGHINN